MWRRVVSSSLSKLRPLAPISASSSRRSALKLTRRFLSSPPPPPASSFAAASFQGSAIVSDRILKSRVEDVMPIATGHEREELEAELEGKNILEIDYPVGPFGTKEAPAVVKSFYDKRIVGCPGGEGEDEHDVVWFWLEKGKPYECSVCSQHFMLEVVGPGGPHDGHGDHKHH